MTLKVIDARGGIATQNWTILLLPGDNTPPAFASTPVTEAIEDSGWVSQVTVYDLDEDPLVLLLDTIPLGMYFSQDSLRWTPPIPGSYVVRVGVTDGIDSTWQRFVLTVNPSNDPPEIVSDPKTAAIAGANYSYSAVAVDEDGDELTYSLAQSPSGMTVSSDGVVQWLSSQSQSAPVTVELVARDPSNSEDRQTWTITMVPDTIPPTVHIRFSKNPTRPGDAVTATVTASDNVEASAPNLTLDGNR